MRTINKILMLLGIGYTLVKIKPKLIVNNKIKGLDTSDLENIYKKQKQELPPLYRTETIKRILNNAKIKGKLSDDTHKAWGKKVPYKTWKDADLMREVYAKEYGKSYSIYVKDGSYYLSSIPCTKAY